MVTEVDKGVSPKLSEVPSSGLVISVTSSINSFLSAASNDSYLSQDLRDLSSSLIVHSTIPYKSLKTIWLRSKRDARPDLYTLLTGSNFVFTSPKPREKVFTIVVRESLATTIQCIWIQVVCFCRIDFILFFLLCGDLFGRVRS